MFDNTYALRTENAGGITRYYASFTDGQGVRQETEVSESVYLELQLLTRNEGRLCRSDRRHIEQSELTDEMLYARATKPPKLPEEIVIDRLRSEDLRQAVGELSEIQRRRFNLYYEAGLTYEQIAKEENCAFQVVAKAVRAAESKIMKYFEKQG